MSKSINFSLQTSYGTILILGLNVNYRETATSIEKRVDSYFSILSLNKILQYIKRETYI